MTLDKDTLFAKIEQDNHNRKIIKIHIDDWNEDVYLRQLTAGDRATIEARCTKAKATTNWRADHVCSSLCDEEGKLLLPPNLDNFRTLYRAGSRAIEQIFDAVLELNGLNKKAEEEAVENFTMPEE
jgi:hypothetical protein